MRYFVIRGFGEKQDSAGTTFDFNRVDRELIAPALSQCQFEGGTTGQIDDSGSIHEDMFALILEADVVVCDITVHNANVFYELGVRHGPVVHAQAQPDLPVPRACTVQGAAWQVS